jgi:hypothetical protein
MWKSEPDLGFLQNLEGPTTFEKKHKLAVWQSFGFFRKKCQNNQNFSLSKQNPAALKSCEISENPRFQNLYLQANACRFLRP